MPVSDIISIDFPLEIFGGRNTEIPPGDLPEGALPDNQDVAFLPGSVFQRPCLHKQLNLPLPSGETLILLKTYLQTSQNPLTLMIDADGKLWQEDVINNPHVDTFVQQLG